MFSLEVELEGMSPEERAAYLELLDHKKRLDILHEIEFLRRQNADLFKEIDRLTKEVFQLELAIERSMKWPLRNK